MREDCVESSKQLRSLRETHKMTQSDMAAAAECIVRNYQNYEDGKSHPVDIIWSHISLNLPADPRELFESSVYDVNDTTREHINRLLDKCNGDQLRLTLKLVQGILDEWPK